MIFALHILMHGVLFIIVVSVVLPGILTEHCCSAHCVSVWCLITSRFSPPPCWSHACSNWPGGEEVAAKLVSDILTDTQCLYVCCYGNMNYQLPSTLRRESSLHLPNLQW